MNREAKLQELEDELYAAEQERDLLDQEQLRFYGDTSIQSWVEACRKVSVLRREINEFLTAQED